MGKKADGGGARRRQRRSFTPEFKAERDGLTTEEREELRRWRRENKVLREERDILKRVTFFAMETR